MQFTLGSCSSWSCRIFTSSQCLIFFIRVFMSFLKGIGGVRPLGIHVGGSDFLSQLVDDCHFLCIVFGFQNQCQGLNLKEPATQDCLVLRIVNYVRVRATEFLFSISIWRSKWAPLKKSIPHLSIAPYCHCNPFDFDEHVSQYIDSKKYFFCIPNLMHF